MQFTTEIYFSELKSENQDEITKNVIDSLKDNKAVLAEINQELDKENETSEITDETPAQRARAIDSKIEERAEKIINDTFYGEITVGEEELPY